MKIVISRKGFDSSTGGGQSPILPNGDMVSLPIPEPSDKPGVGLPYGSLRFDDEHSYLDVIHELGLPVPDASRGAHLDPDLTRDVVVREDGWRSTLGQCDAAQTHLDNQMVDVGDVFLFFGRFRRTERISGRLRWLPGAPIVHALFGYMEIGQRIRLRPHDSDEVPSWAMNHPHVRDRNRGSNTLYVASDRLTLLPDHPGAGLLRFSPRTCLSKGGGSPTSTWTLPACFAPSGSPRALSCHNKPERWTVAPDGTVTLQSVGRGQEFATDADAEVQDWVRSIIQSERRTA